MATCPLSCPFTWFETWSQASDEMSPTESLFVPYLKVPFQLFKLFTHLFFEIILFIYPSIFY